MSMVLIICRMACCGWLGAIASARSNVFNYGFVWVGTRSQLPSGGIFPQIAYPGATYQFTHSSMGNLAVGNADGPQQAGRSNAPDWPRHRLHLRFDQPYLCD